MLEKNTQIAKKDIFLRNAAFTFMIGFLLYHLFPFPPIIWRLGLVITSLIGLCFHIQNYKFVKTERAMLCFLIINIIYYIISFIWQTPESTNFGDVLCVTLPLFLFYYLSVRGAVSDKSLQMFLVIVAIAAVSYFYHAESLLLIDLYHAESGEITNNASVIFLVLIPLLFFVKNKPLFFILMAEICYFILNGAKRGNIVAAIIPLLLVSINQVRFHSSKYSKFILIIAFFALSLYAYNMSVNNEYLMKRIEQTYEGDTSNRDVIYERAWHTWHDSEHFKNIILGYGTDGTVREMGGRAHNDWLEILVNFGILGVVFYFIFFVSLFQTVLKLWKTDRETTNVLLSVLCIWFLKSLFSMGFTENLFSYLSMAIGIALGRLHRRPEEDSRILGKEL